MLLDYGTKAALANKYPVSLPGGYCRPCLQILARISLLMNDTQCSSQVLTRKRCATKSRYCRALINIFTCPRNTLTHLKAGKLLTSKRVKWMQHGSLINEMYLVTSSWVLIKRVLHNIITRWSVCVYVCMCTQHISVYTDTSMWLVLLHPVFPLFDKKIF